MTIKLSYPNFDAGISLKPSYDIAKWMNAFKNISLNTYYGASEQDAIKQATAGWNKVELRDFENWIRYIKTRDYLKYDVKVPQVKTAQFKHDFYVNESLPGYFLPNPKNIPSPVKDMSDLDEDPKEMLHKPQQLQNETKRKIIEDQRKKIIGRLHSVEKLLTSPEGHIFAGKDFEALLNAIYELKKQIQTINKMTIANSIYNDLIIRKANLLEKNGHKEGSVILKKIAQYTPGAFQAKEGPLPLGSKTDGTGSLQNETPSLDSLTSTPPIEVSEKPEEEKQTEQTTPASLTEATPSAVAPSPDQSLLPTTKPAEEKPEKEFEGMEGALDNLGTFGLTDVNRIDDVEVNAFDYPFEIVVEAQDIPPSTEKLRPAKPLTPTSKEDVKKSDKADKIDVLIDGALGNVTIADIINKIENILAVYKRRELTRQLSLIDLMLDRVGLSAYFDSMSEVINRSAESSTYISTRLEDMLARLQGAIESHTVDLTPEVARVSPEAEKVKRNLEMQDKEEAQRKELKQKVKDKSMTEKMEGGKEVPEVESAPEEIAEKPTEIAPMPKPPVAPEIAQTKSVAPT